MTNGYRDFLVESPPTVETGISPAPLLDPNDWLKHSYIELLKSHPTVLAQTIVERGGATGNGTIDSGDTSQHKVYFQVGGKPVVVYKLLVFSTFSGVVSMSVAGLANTKDGIPFTSSSEPLVLDTPVDGVYVRTDGTAACAITDAADSTAGAFKIFGFTIPDFDARGFSE